MRAIDATPDITLAELRERLITERGETFALSTIHDFYRRHRTRSKKDGARQRASARGRSRTPRGLVRSPARARPGEARLHRRDRGHHQDGSAARAQPPRRAMSRRGSAWPLEDHHAGRGPAPRRPHGTHDRRRGDERRRLHSLCRDLPRTHPRAGRYRHPGQSAGPQGQRRPAGDRARRRQPHVPPPYSPDFNPIEQVFAKIKALLPRPPPGRWMPSKRPSPPPSTRSFPTSAQTTHKLGLRSQIDANA